MKKIDELLQENFHKTSEGFTENVMKNVAQIKSNQNEVKSSNLLNWLIPAIAMLTIGMLGMVIQVDFSPQLMLASLACLSIVSLLLIKVQVLKKNQSN